MYSAAMLLPALSLWRERILPEKPWTWTSTMPVNSLTKKFLGIPIKLALELRAILEIKRLLIYSNSSLKEIGANMGFKEPTNFNKFFKKIAKQTPNEFRYSNN